jgi:cell wall-associated NlpC family hydrolase
VNPQEAQALSALARQLTPQADERGFDLQVRTACALVSSLLLLAIGADAAQAANTGGATAGSTGSTPTTASPAPTLHLFPVTARSSNIAYKGPVYVKTATGEVVPYSPTTGSTTTGTAASATGGSAPAAPKAEPALEMPSTEAGSANSPTQRPQLLVPGTTARYVNGLAAAPMSAPPAIQQIIWAGNELIGLPYIYGGGHGSFTSSGYDCSGTVSFALHGASLLKTPEDSSEFEHFGSHGIGRWIAIFSNPGHAYMTVAGLRLDTSSADDPSDQQGPRWRPLRQSNGGYRVRHPLGL